MWAEQTVPSGIAALIVATVPLWIAPARRAAARAASRGRRACGSGRSSASLGVALVARPEGEVGAGHWLAILALQVACLSWTVGSLYAQSVPKRLPLASAAAIEMLAGALVLVAASLALRRGLGADGGRLPPRLGRDRLPRRLRLARGLHRVRLLPERAARDAPSAPTPTSTRWSRSSSGRSSSASRSPRVSWRGAC